MDARPRGWTVGEEEGLVRLVLQEQFEIHLPSYTREYTRIYDVQDISRLIRCESRKWKMVESGSEQCGLVGIVWVNTYMREQLCDGL